MAVKKDEEVIKIMPLVRKRIKMRIVGETPLLVHAWSEKAKKMMLGTQTGGITKKEKKKKDPFDDFMESLYWIGERPKESTPEAFSEAVRNGAKFGFKVEAIKAAANSAAYRMGWVKNKKALQGTYFLYGDQNNDFSEVRGSVPEIREDMVRLATGVADIRYRGEFANWYIDFTLEYSTSGTLSLEDIVNCINAGGFAVGIGEWRPERNGTHGMFHVEAEAVE